MNHRLAQKGFTLVELIITVFLLTVVLVTIYTVYFSSSRAATMQTQDAKMQDNARMAMDVMARSIMKMGMLIDFSKYPSGTNFTNYNGITTTPLVVVNSSTGPDQVVLAGIPVRGSATTLTLVASKGSGAMLTVQTPGNIPANSIIAIGLSDTAFVGASGANPIMLQNTASGNPKLLNLNYPGAGVAAQTPTVITPLTAVQFFIDDTTVSTHPVLMVRDGVNAPMPLAEDIEDLQIAYGVDSNNDKTIQNGEWINQITGKQQTDQLRMVRITIVARTAHQDPSLRGVSRSEVPAIEDRPARNVNADGYRRFILTRIIQCRNMNTTIPL